MTDFLGTRPVSSRPADHRQWFDPAALMALYDLNYQCLLALCPPLRNPASQDQEYLDDSRPGMPTLKLAVDEHTRHTTTFGLTCRWENGEEENCLPDVRVRLYRDSRQAELLGHSGIRQFLPDGIPAGSQPAEWLGRRYSGNRLLFYWLRYCLRQGYHLSAEPERIP